MEQNLTVAYPVVMVLGGLALSFVPGLPEVKLNPDIVFYFFLPPLLYPAALFTSWRDFRRNLRPILLLAIGLVLVTTVTIAWVAHTILPHLSLGGCVRAWGNFAASGSRLGYRRPPSASGSASHPDASLRRKAGERRHSLGRPPLRSCGIHDRHFLFGPRTAPP